MNIVLCGFMGCGKTTVGKIVAKRTGLQFVDMDAYIEEKAGMSVSRIFEQYGEAKFRKMETEAAVELSRRSGLIIATGGGAVLNPENVKALKSGGVIVMLQVSPETIIYRLRNNTTRPLLQRPDKEEVIRQMIAERNPIYKSAASIIVSANLPSGQVAVQVIQFIKKYIDK